MGTLEVNNPRMLGVFALSCTLIVACDLYIKHGGLAAAVFLEHVFFALVFLRRNIHAIEAMDEHGKKYAKADATHLCGGGNNLLGPAPMKRMDVIRQTDPDIANDVDLLRQRALELAPSFTTNVVHVLGAAVVAGSPPHETLGPNVKGLERSLEKIRMDYDEDVSQLKDVLRCSTVCEQMDGVCTCCAELEKLEADGVVEILQIKKRFRGAAAPGGYRDINVTILFRGLICEVQIHLRAYFVLKDDAHPCYELCRSLNLVGPLPPDSTRRASVVARATKQMPLGLRLTLGFLRFCTGCFAVVYSVFYLQYMLRDNFILPSQPFGPFMICYALTLAAPFSNVVLMECSDLLFGAATTSRWEAAMYVAFGCIFLLCMGVAIGGSGLFVMLGTVCVYLFHVAVAVAAKQWYGSSGHHRHSRVATLSQKFLGINGTYFVNKTAVLQLASVVLQVTAKLPALGAAVMMKGALPLELEWAEPSLEPLYWIFVGALGINAVVPSALLSCERRSLQ
jgi:hypothetical protein